MIWLLEGLRLLARSRSRSLLLMLCWTLALALAVAAGWGWSNSPQLRQALTRRVPAECYLAGADTPVLARVRSALQVGSTLEWAGLLDADQAAGEFRDGFGVDVVELLGENPFPPTVLLRVRADADTAELDRDLGTLRQVEGVTGTYVDRRLLGDLGRQLRRLGRMILAAGILLSALTLALLAVSARSLLRAWRGEAVLLALHGARPWELALPPATALALPAGLALGAALGLVRALQDWLAGLGWATRLVVLSWPLALGALLPLALGVFLIFRRMCRLTVAA